MVAVSLKKKFFKEEDGIRDQAVSRGLGDVYKRQVQVVGILSCTGIKIADSFGIDQISIFILNSQAVMPNMARRPKVIRVFLSIIK